MGLLKNNIVYYLIAVLSLKKRRIVVHISKIRNLGLAYGFSNHLFVKADILLAYYNIYC